MMKTKSSREIVESYYEAVGEKEVHPERGISVGDIDHIRQILAEDIEWIHPALGGTFHGLDSVINDVLIPFWQNWEVTLDSPRFIEDNDTIVVLATYRATHMPTGKPVVEPVAHVWDLKDGKIVRLHQYVDTASITRQMEA
jgi:ketosteroid isomerase-like protein